MRRCRRFLCAGLLLGLGGILLPPLVTAEIVVIDDAGNKVALSQPARRIVSLAPHATELLFEAGAGEFIVGVVEHSDHPEAARQIPKVGSGFGLDLEMIAGLRPDLVVAWQSGNPSWQTGRIRQLGLPVFMTEPRHLEDVAGLIERLGTLAGTGGHARQAAAEFLRARDILRDRYAGRDPVPVLYQILDNGLLTVSRRHLIDDVIRLCGGDNVFAGLPGLTPRIDMESVLRKNPEAILASGLESMWPVWHARWRQWTSLDATARGNLFFIPPDLIHRNSPRILQGARKVCAALESARQARKSN